MPNYEVVDTIPQNHFGVRFGEKLNIVGNSLVKYEKVGTNVKMIIELTFTPHEANWDNAAALPITPNMGNLAISSVNTDSNTSIDNPSIACFSVDEDEIKYQFSVAPPPPNKGVHGN